MATRTSLGRDFGWLWAAYAVSAYGTSLAFGAFSLIAIQVLHAGPAAVSALAAAGLAVGAVVAVPLGPWVEFRHKRPVMIGMDLVRFTALLTIPVAYGLGVLSFAQLVTVSVVVTAARITFTAASGAYLKALVPREYLLVANGRFEATNWSATILGPTLGGAATGLLGPVTTIVADAVSYVLSAVGITTIGGNEPPPPTRAEKLRPRDLAEGWRYLLRHDTVRPLFINGVLVNGLIMATEPLLAVLMLGPLGFSAWEYGLAFAVPCIGGLVGSRLARRVVLRYDQRTVMLTLGTLRACWPLGLVLIRPGADGLLIVMGIELGLIICMSIYSPVLATYRLQHTDTSRLARVLSAWSVTSSATIAALTALWGVLADITSPRTAIGIAGLLLLATPFCLPWRTRRSPG